MNYDWDGVKTRRIKALKIGVSLLLAGITLVAPKLFMLKFY
jgi:hypothetical protein